MHIFVRLGSRDRQLCRLLTAEIDSAPAGRLGLKNFNLRNRLSAASAAARDSRFGAVGIVSRFSSTTLSI
jgi:hypothetical protein